MAMAVLQTCNALNLRLPPITTQRVHIEHFQAVADNEQVQATNPCSEPASTPCGISYGPTNTYDMLGRLVSSVQSGSNATTTITYNENDVTSVLTPAPSGENSKGTEKQYNALGWLKSTCAISSVVSGEVACGQNTGSHNGVLTTVTYSSSTGFFIINPLRSSQHRKTVLDGLGRKTEQLALNTVPLDGNTFTTGILPALLDGRERRDSWHQCTTLMETSMLVPMTR